MGFPLMESGFDLAPIMASAPYPIERFNQEGKLAAAGKNDLILKDSQ